MHGWSCSRGQGLIGTQTRLSEQVWAVCAQQAMASRGVSHIRRRDLPVGMLSSAIWSSGMLSSDLTSARRLFPCAATYHPTQDQTLHSARQTTSIRSALCVSAQSGKIVHLFGSLCVGGAHQDGLAGLDVGDHPPAPVRHDALERGLERLVQRQLVLLQVRVLGVVARVVLTAEGPSRASQTSGDRDGDRSN
jgi:hypothetical protein